MIDSLQMGGIEHQFAAIASALRRGLFRINLGLQRSGPFLQPLQDIVEYKLGSGFLSPRVNNTAESMIL